MKKVINEYLNDIHYLKVDCSDERPNAIIDKKDKLTILFQYYTLTKDKTVRDALIDFITKGDDFSIISLELSLAKTKSKYLIEYYSTIRVIFETLITDIRLEAVINHNRENTYKVLYAFMDSYLLVVNDIVDKTGLSINIVRKELNFLTKYDAYSDPVIEKISPKEAGFSDMKNRYRLSPIGENVVDILYSAGRAQTNYCKWMDMMGKVCNINANILDHDAD